MATSPRKDSILVVDDEPGLRDMLAILFRREGYEVTLAPGFVQGKDAVKNANSPYGVVLTDLMMPDGSGLDLLSLIKERSENGGRGPRSAVCKPSFTCCYSASSLGSLAGPTKGTSKSGSIGTSRSGHTC